MKNFNLKSPSPILEPGAHARHVRTLFGGAVTLGYEFTDKNRKPRKEIVKKHNGNISWCLHVVIL